MKVYTYHPRTQKTEEKGFQEVAWNLPYIKQITHQTNYTSNPISTKLTFVKEKKYSSEYSWAINNIFSLAHYCMNNKNNINYDDYRSNRMNSKKILQTYIPI